MSGVIGIIGGSGLYRMGGLTVREERRVGTPFGEASGKFVLGSIDGVEVAFLARHGAGHTLLPTELNFRANIWAFKSLGVDTLLSASAVGSMKPEYQPMDVVFPDQFIDRTRHRVDTFFGEGIVAHVSLADPVCSSLLKTLAGAAREETSRVHEGGTYVCIEGPQFSTRAESYLYQSWNADVVGMTNMQEARLAREAEICYVTMGLVTDYDCWHQVEEAVNVGQVLERLRLNAETATATIRKTVPRIAAQARSCGCRESLSNSVLTPPDAMPVDRREMLRPVLNRYLQSRV